jgi:hypothetical protein
MRLRLAVGHHGFRHFALGLDTLIDGLLFHNSHIVSLLVSVEVAEDL